MRIRWIFDQGPVTPRHDGAGDQGDRVLLDGVGYEAKWWSRGQRPDRAILDRDYSPWTPIEDAAAEGAAAAG